MQSSPLRSTPNIFLNTLLSTRPQPLFSITWETKCYTTTHKGRFLFPHDQPTNQSWDDKEGIRLVLLFNYAMFKTVYLTCDLCRITRAFRFSQDAVSVFWNLAPHRLTCARRFERAWWCHLQGTKYLNYILSPSGILTFKGDTNILCRRLGDTVPHPWRTGTSAEVNYIESCIILWYILS